MDFQTLNMLFRYSKEFSHSRIRSRGLSDTECLICSYAYHHSPCTQDDVVQGLHIDKTTAAKAMQSLEEKGFIERRSDEADKRRKILSLTESGIESCADIIHLHDRWLGSVMSALNADEQAQFEEYCVKLIKKAQALISDKKD